MNVTDYPVRIYCPIIDGNEIVYFHPENTDGHWSVHRDSFNGCERNYHGCNECEVCKAAAFEIMKVQIT